MTHDGERDDTRDDRAVPAARPPLGVLVVGAPSCRVVDLLEDWDRSTRAQAQRVVEDLRRR